MGFGICGGTATPIAAATTANAAATTVATATAAALAAIAALPAPADSALWPAPRPLFAPDLSDAACKPGSWAWRDGILTPTGADLIWTRDTHGDFLLSLEFRCAAAGADSGLFIRCSDPRDPVQNALEIQILQGDAQGGNPRTLVGAIYSAAAPSRQIEIDPGKWYQLLIEAAGPRVAVYIDGERLLSADLDRWTTPSKNPDGTGNKFKRPLRDFPRTGQIGLSRSKQVTYRNLFIDPLPLADGRARSPGAPPPAAAPTPAAATLIAYVTSTPWTARIFGGKPSTFKFNPDFTYDETWQGRQKRGSWRPATADTIIATSPENATLAFTADPARKLLHRKGTDSYTPVNPAALATAAATTAAAVGPDLASGRDRPHTSATPPGATQGRALPPAPAPFWRPKPTDWQFAKGTDPLAEGALTTLPPAADAGAAADPAAATLRLTGDFTRGKGHVRAVCPVKFPDATQFRAKLRTDQNRFLIRITDATGQTHQQSVSPPPRETREVMIPLIPAGRGSYWGGASDGVLHTPVREIALLIAAGDLEGKTGFVEISDARFVKAPPLPPLPPASATEQWQPEPPLVAVPAATGIPSDATLLFDGTGLDAWQALDSANPVPRWTLNPAERSMTVAPGVGSIRTKAALGDIQLHLEWRSPAEVKKSGQSRGNSGILLMGLYELQILDSHDNKTYVNGQAASIYKQFPPLANASRPPGEWQSFDIVFIAPRFDAAGELLSPARLTVFHNGVLVQHDTALRGPTMWRGIAPYKAHAGKLPFILQNHAGDLVSYRNIWYRDLDFPPPPPLPDVPPPPYGPTP